LLLLLLGHHGLVLRGVDRVHHRLALLQLVGRRLRRRELGLWLLLLSKTLLPCATEDIALSATTRSKQAGAKGRLYLGQTGAASR
jgi:hypothetical protein